jgi:prephenate dehydrogenase
MSTPKIAIIGAGPVGCLLARILSISNTPVTVYESDISPDYRSQGGTLDLHRNTGIAAIKDSQVSTHDTLIISMVPYWSLVTRGTWRPIAGSMILPQARFPSSSVG